MEQHQPMVRISRLALRDRSAQLNCRFEFSEEVVELRACMEISRTVSVGGSEIVERMARFIQFASLYELLYAGNRIVSAHWLGNCKELGATFVHGLVQRLPMTGLMRANAIRHQWPALPPHEFRSSGIQG
ncbi:hypothetical protein [Burkholderia ubonensis]|uniref:hypothetical protein n=1 Tax=Burkholderia ubonensis TaxID=101571 RepID=UPI0012FA2F97|nr:hypothetical protein [Burkholderia ubonensis]